MRQDAYSETYNSSGSIHTQFYWIESEFGKCTQWSIVNTHTYVRPDMSDMPTKQIAKLNWISTSISSSISLTITAVPLFTLQTQIFQLLSLVEESSFSSCCTFTIPVTKFKISQTVWLTQKNKCFPLE